MPKFSPNAISSHDDITNESKHLQQDGINSNKALFVNTLPSEKEFWARITNILSESQINQVGKNETMDWCELQIVNLLEMLEFGDTTYSGVFLEYALNWLEDRQVNSMISGLRIINILRKVLVCDTGKSQQTRVVKLFWKHVHHLSVDLGIYLGKIAIHYTPPEVGRQELKELLQLVENPEMFLDTYSMAAVHNTPFSTDPNSTALNRINEYGVKATFWADKEKQLVKNASSKWASTMSTNFPEPARLRTAHQCLHHLDLTINYMSSDTNLLESDLLSSVVRSVMSTEIEALKSMREEAKLHRQFVDRLETLTDQHLRAYNALKEEQYERTNEFLQICLKEKDDEVKETLYNKAKCLASIEKASISTDVKLTSEDLLKRIVNKAGSALKEVEGRLESKVNSNCALCYSKFSSKRKRACLAPCGHTGACLTCATRAWEQNPRCPWCKAAIEKPIPLPPKLFFR